MRVDVWTGDMGDYIGKGTLLERVNVFIWQTKEGQIVSSSNAEEAPAHLVAELGEPLMIPNNPKIKIDDGGIVYGCQVWWQEIKNES